MAGAGFGAAFRQLRGLFGGGSVVGLGDGPLLARYADSKDEAAFGALVARHGPMVLATCRAVLKNEHDVEDAFQATFLVLAKKAHSVRGGDALGGWLHRVAHRASVQAGIEARRRRLKEAEAPPREAPGRPDAELAAVLHEEIDRLPERQRLPVVLCDLEGLTADQAARHLRWTEPTVRHRLADARKRLKDRLTRRGVTPSALGSLPAVVPASLARLTIASATGGTTSAGALLLTHTLLRGMLMSQIKLASSAALAALALGTVGWMASGGPEDPKQPAMKPTGQAQAATPARTSMPEATRPAETFELGGVVRAPDGQPVAGATVRLADAPGAVGPPPEAKSGPDGRFTLRVARSLRDGFPDRIVARYPRMVASAPGFSPGWVEGVFRPDTVPTGWGITLVEAGPPIEGRVVDLEGRPVAGVRVESDNLMYPEGGDLPAWIESARAAGVRGIWRELQNLSIEPAVVATAGDDGRFRMDGPGRGRVARLIVKGPSIATEMVYVLGSDLPELRTTDRGSLEPRPFVLHAPRFQHAAATSPPIEGVIRDKDTGRPIVGVRLLANILREGDHTMIEGIEATTDAEGRYRLTGLPKAKGYRLFTFPRVGSPYLNGTFVVADGSPGPDAIPFDLALKRGVLVRGRVTDKVTGRPVKAGIDVVTFADNPHLRDFPGYAESYRSNAHSKADGRFEVVALPGRGIITVRADDALYRGGVGGEDIRGPKAGPGSPADFNTRPEYINSRNYHSLAGLDLDPSAESATRDLQVDPGRSLTIHAVDPDGRPIGGNLVTGIGDIYQVPLETPSATFEVHALDPSRPRRLRVRHDGRKLIGTLYLKGDESGEKTVRLQPWGVVTGRIVDDEGRPRPGIEIFDVSNNPDGPSEDQDYLPGQSRNLHVATDINGRFRAEGLIPGLKYGPSAIESYRVIGRLFEDVTVAPGEVKDLGDLKIQPPKPPGD